MKEIVKQIMETETEVREAVEKAREEAQKIVRDAETRSRDIIEKGRQEAVLEARELVEKYRADAERERGRQIAAVKDVSGELLTSKADRIEGAVRKVLDIVKGT